MVLNMVYDENAPKGTLPKIDHDGVLIPDHTPQMSCDGAWYAGMAYAMGYMKTALTLLNE